MQTNTGMVGAVLPAMLPIAGAASYCGCSPAYLDKLRAQDAKRRGAGEAITGPEWCRFAGRVMYRRADLDAWIARTAEVGAVFESKRRMRAVEAREDVATSAE